MFIIKKQTSHYLYCTSEPCPMCLSAIHWSGIKECYFIADRKLAATYGFDDEFLYSELAKPISNRKMIIEKQGNLSDNVEKIFDAWKKTGLPLC